ncbi:MAG: hypothetical protein DLM55_07200 [Acidimicrobiales bacterium]|nr:MAG: hypothetical protein DLM55_07200 [Acidimicrobiales bacterium]
MTSPRGPWTPRAARKSIGKLYYEAAKASARPGEFYDAAELVHRFFYGKVLDRLFADGTQLRQDGHHPWILKGSLARTLLRAPNDLDLCRPGTIREEALSAFEGALATDLDDGFSFEILDEDGRDTRSDSVWFPVLALLNGAPIIKFEVDLTHLNPLVNAPELVTSPLTSVQFDDTSTPYLRYSVEDHVIDKYCAILRKKKYSDGKTRSSVRFGDYVDIVDILTLGEPIDMESVRKARDVKGPQDGVDFSEPFSLPDHELWRYQCEKTMILSGRSAQRPSFDQSLELVTSFWNVLQSEQQGIWNPQTLSVSPLPEILETEKSQLLLPSPKREPWPWRSGRGPGFVRRNRTRK